MSLTKGSGYRCATNLGRVGAVFHIRVSAPTRCSETFDVGAEVESCPPNITCPEPLMSLNHSSLDNRNVSDGTWKMGTCKRNFRRDSSLHGRFRFRHRCPQPYLCEINLSASLEPPPPKLCTSYTTIPFTLPPRLASETSLPRTLLSPWPAATSVTKPGKRTRKIRPVR